jgi:hypothetical protein
MFPLFMSRLLSLEVPDPGHGIPAPLIAKLKTRQIHYLHRSVTQIAALIELQREFDRCGITVLPWKGPSVGQLLYGSPILRESGDLDFLFLEKNLQVILEITRRLGYLLPGSHDSESKYLYSLALQREFTFIRERDQVVLEFHLQILTSRFSSWQDAPADIRHASTVCRLAGVDLLMQSPEDLLISLCVHATKHDWERLKWACDIAQFLSVYEDKIDWKQLLTRLRKQRKHSVVLLGLSLVENLFDLSLPASIYEALRQNSEVVLLAKSVAAHIMSGSTDPIEIRHRRSMIALLCPRLRDRIAYTMRPIVELNYEDLYISVDNRMLFFMNYFFRIARLLRKYGPWQLVNKTAVSVRSVR